MTFHKAKGLEFDVVINIFWKNKPKPPDIYFDISGDFLYLYRINKSYYKAFKEKKIYDEIIRSYKEGKRNEALSNINLLYVALTRAKYELYNIVVKNKTSLKIFDIFENDSNGKKLSRKNKSVEDFYYINNFSFNYYRNYPFIKDVEFETEEKKRGRIFHSVFKMIDFIDEKPDFEILIKKAFIFEKIDQCSCYNELGILSVTPWNELILFKDRYKK